MRRPEADFLRDGVHALRIRLGTVNYRILYFHQGQAVAVLVHALTKEASVPSREIDHATRRMQKMRRTTMKTTRDAVKMLDQMVGVDSQMRAMLEEERENLRGARMVCEARTAAGLTQAELAARVGMRPWVIARLEDADYEGQTLDVLARIARSLDQRVEARLVPRQAAITAV